MLKLFYSPGACSLVPHIALEEAGAEFTPLRIPIAEGGNLTAEFLAINPHARLPALDTDRGIITENIAVLNFIADRFGAPGSVPRGDPHDAARCNELLGWFSSSVHIAFAEVWRGGRFTTTRACGRRSRRAAARCSPSSSTKSRRCASMNGWRPAASLRQTVMR